MNCKKLSFVMSRTIVSVFVASDWFVVTSWMTSLVFGNLRSSSVSEASILKIMENDWIFVANKNCMAKQKLGVVVAC